MEAGEPRRPLADGDILRIEAITEREILVRRLLDPDLSTGRCRRHGPAGGRAAGRLVIGGGPDPGGVTAGYPAHPWRGDPSPLGGGGFSFSPS